MNPHFYKYIGPVLAKSRFLMHFPAFQFILKTGSSLFSMGKAAEGLKAVEVDTNKEG
ncbi:MAG: hypothetical protein WC661_21440 [Opitutaceae bacterium]|jgi:hypothetical protein